MTPGQTRVMGLIIVLFVLEAYRVPAIKSFVLTAVYNGKSALFAASQPKAGP